MTTKEIDKTIRFNSEIQQIEKVNPLFSRATIKVLYTGFNRNGSYFSKDSVLKSIDSIYNIPLVGEYIEHADNFGDHGTSLEIKGNEIKLVQSTKPYGLIPESANIYWEDVTEKNGVVNEYLIVDGAYLWTGRYEELNTMLEQPFNQSMEIEVVNGNFAVIDGKETFNVDEFLFSALCILGIDKDGEGHVEPAFESASITTYSLDKDDFKKQFNQMVAELKFSLNQEGGNEMTKKTEPESPATEVMSTLDMFTESQFAEAHEMNIAFNSTTADEPANVDSDNVDNSTESSEAKDVTKDETNPDDSESTQKESDEDTAETKDEAPAAQEFSLTARQLQDQLRSVLGKEHFHDEWGYQCRKYWYVDNTDTTVIFENGADNYQLHAANYTLSGDIATIKFDTAFKVKVEYVPFEGESVAFTANLERFEVDKETTKTKLDELNTYKRQREESDIKAKFEGKLSDEEFTQVFSEMKDSELDKVEDKLFALIGKKNFSISTQTKDRVNKIAIPTPKEVEYNPYGGIFD